VTNWTLIDVHISIRTHIFVLYLSPTLSICVTTQYQREWNLTSFLWYSHIYFHIHICVIIYTYTHSLTWMVNKAIDYFSLHFTSTHKDKNAMRQLWWGQMSFNHFHSWRNEWARVNWKKWVDPNLLSIPCNFRFRVYPRDYCHSEQQITCVYTFPFAPPTLMNDWVIRRIMLRSSSIFPHFPLFIRPFFLFFYHMMLWYQFQLDLFNKCCCFSCVCVWKHNLAGLIFLAQQLVWVEVEVV
jgi:hypothetical protein